VPFGAEAACAAASPRACAGATARTASSADAFVPEDALPGDVSAAASPDRVASAAASPDRVASAAASPGGVVVVFSPGRAVEESALLPRTASVPRPVSPASGGRAASALVLLCAAAPLALRERSPASSVAGDVARPDGGEPSAEVRPSLTPVDESRVAVV